MTSVQRANLTAQINVLVAPDSLKGSLGSIQAAQAICHGLERLNNALPHAEIRSEALPLADGGEGFVDVLYGPETEKRQTSVRGPHGQGLEAQWLFRPRDRVAIIESAQAISLGACAGRDPLRASSYGLGQLLSAAAAEKPRRIVIGLGGSGTNDGGVGMLEALGAQITLANDTPQDTGLGAWVLGAIKTLDLSAVREKFADIDILIASDVESPLLGPTGATFTYGPQKGLGPKDCQAVDAAMAHWHELVGGDAQASGAGASGGIGYALQSALGARTAKGIEVLLDFFDFDKRLATADVLISAEGRFDASTLAGKTCKGLAARAKAQDKTFFVLAGGIGDDPSISVPNLLGHGIAGVFPICTGPMALEDAMEKTPALLARAAQTALMAYLAGRGSSP